MSCLGSVVGTGNIWRYPRIVALHAGGGGDNRLIESSLLYLSSGALVFLIVWCCFLWIWSIPLILIEYATGRYFRKGTVESAYKLAGPSFRFMGAWMVVVSNAIGSVPYHLTTISFVYNRCYYSVLLGYCLYYFIYHLFNALPDNLDQSFENWYYMHVSETRKLSRDIVLLLIEQFMASTLSCCVSTCGSCVCVEGCVID